MALLAKSGRQTLARRGVAARPCCVAPVRPSRPTRQHADVRAMSAATAEEAELRKQLTNLDRVTILSEALPYLQRFRGKTVVVKYGGAAMKDPTLKLGYGESAMLDKLLYEEEVKKCVDCYEQQFHYAVFYAYMKLREQEIRNIMWVSECVAQDQKGRIVDGIVYLF